jgi:glucose/arabinose dehydrogenase
VQAVLACQSVKGDKAQLACFRRAAKLLTQEPAASPQAETAPAPTAEAPPPRAPPDRQAEARAAMLVVRSIGDLGDGRAILNLADGSSWVETEPEPIISAVKPGDTVRLEKGVLGGYLLVLPHRSVIRMRRLRTE